MNILNFLGLFGLAGGDAGGGDGSGGEDGGGQGGSPDDSGHIDGRDLPVVPSWASNFPGELTGDEGSRNYLSRFKGDGAKVEVPVEMVKSAIETNKMRGGMVKIPEENATQADIQVFNKKMGVPENPEGYEFKVPDKTPDGFFRPEELKAFGVDAHELGIPKAKAEVLFDRFAKRQIESYSNILDSNQKTIQERVDGLKAEFGNEYDATVQTADKAVHFADPAMLDVFEKAGLLGHPAIVKGFAKIGKALGEGTLKGVDTGVPSETHTKESLEAMMKDPRYKLPQGDPVGKQWRAKVDAGFKQLYPGTAGGDINPSAGRALHGA